MNDDKTNKGVFNGFSCFFVSLSLNPFNFIFTYTTFTFTTSVISVGTFIRWKYFHCHQKQLALIDFGKIDKKHINT